MTSLIVIFFYRLVLNPNEKLQSADVHASMPIQRPKTTTSSLSRVFEYLSLRLLEYRTRKKVIIRRNTRVSTADDGK